MKQITLHLSGQNSLYLLVGEGGGKLESALERQTCPSCGSPDCCQHPDDEDDNDIPSRLKYNGFLDAVEAIVLAHASAGLNVESQEYILGLETALDGAAHNYFN